MNTYTKETEEFAKKYTPKEGDEIVLWQGDDNIGFTVLRNYPSNIPFNPVKTKSGKTDSICMIKVGSPLRKVNNESEDFKLFVMVSKASRYLLSNHFNYDFSDPESPTKDSLDESKRSKQPIDLEDFDGYVFDRKNNKIFNIEKGKKEVSLNEIVENIYKLHLKTIKFTGIWFRLKFNIKNNSSNTVESINKTLIWILNFLWAKTIQDEKRDDFGRGLYKPYKHSSLYSLSNEQINLFNSGIIIPKKSAILTSFVIVIATIYLTYFTTNYTEWWNELRRQSEIIQIPFLLFFVWIVDYVIPHIILAIINALIVFRKATWEWKIKIK